MSPCISAPALGAPVLEWLSSGEFARSGFDARIWFKKIGGAWKLFALTKGD